MEIEDKLLKFRQEAKLNVQKTQAKPFSFSNLFNFVQSTPNPNEKIEKKQVSTENKPPQTNKTKPHSDSLIDVKKRNPIIKNKNKEADLAQPEADPPEAVDDSESLKLKIIKLSLKFLLWAILFAIFIRFEFGVVYLVVSLLVIIYLNTGVRKKKGHLSAYSVFNPNLERIEGTVTAEQLQKNLMGGF